MRETEFDASAIETLVEDIGESSAREVLLVFFKDAAEKVALLSAIESADEIDAITRHTHSIKSAAAAFGFTRISSLARKIENEAAGQSMAAIKADIAALRAAVENAHALSLF